MTADRTREVIDWAEAIKASRDPLPMEPEIWAAGADIETAHFVARMLRQTGYYLVRPTDIGWEDIQRFQAALRAGQGVEEDAGGFFARCIQTLLGIPTDPVTPYREAARQMLEGME